MRRLTLLAALLALAACRSTAWRMADGPTDEKQLQRDIAGCRLESQQVQGIDPFPTWMRLSAYNDCMTAKGYRHAQGERSSVADTPYPCTRVDADGIVHQETCTLATEGVEAKARHADAVARCMDRPMTIAMFDYRSAEGLEAAREHCEREAGGD